MKYELVKKYVSEHSQIYKKIKSLIVKYDKIIVFRHIKPDFDALGSQMGLVTFLKDNFPNKEIHYVGDNHVSFIPRLYPEMEKLNDSTFTNFLSIVVDVGDDERIADPRYKKANDIIKIDHHPAKNEITKYRLCDEKKAAASELVTSLLLTWKGKYLSPLAASYLYTALVGDTGRFLYSSTSQFTFEIAQGLLNTNFNLNDLYLRMYEKQLADLKVTAYVLNNFHVSPHGVAYYLLDEKTQKELEITSERGKENVNLFSNIANINAWCSISEDNNPKDYCWRVSIRSKKVDISPIANKYRGGGHPNASGAKLLSLDELDSFIKDLDDLFI